MKALEEKKKILLNAYLDFTKLFNEFETLKNKKQVDINEKKSLLKMLVKLFILSCRILQQYLIYNGCIQYNIIETIKHSLYMDIIDYGQEWMYLFHLYDEFYINKKYGVGEKLYNYATSENVKIFTQFKDYFDKEIKEL